MPKPSLSLPINEVDLVNDVLMYCQLPLIGGTTLSNVQPQSDAHLVYRLLIKNHRLFLSRGQWFNTLFDVDVTVVDDGVLALTLPEHVGVDTVLGIHNVRPLPYSGDEFKKFLDTDISNYVRALDDTGESIGKIDVFWAVDMPLCPPGYLDYLTTKTASDYASMIAIPFNPEVLYKAERDWQIENAQEEPIRNLFCPKYAD